MTIYEVGKRKMDNTSIEEFDKKILLMYSVRR